VSLTFVALLHRLESFLHRFFSFLHSFVPGGTWSARKSAIPRDSRESPFLQNVPNLSQRISVSQAISGLFESDPLFLEKFGPLGVAITMYWKGSIFKYSQATLFKNALFAHKSAFLLIFESDIFHVVPFSDSKNTTQHRTSSLKRRGSLLNSTETWSVMKIRCPKSRTFWRSRDSLA
jgi:hypothetical protein